MERISELTSATVTMLTQNYVLLAALLAIVLVFAIYVYMTPKVLEFFAVAAPVKAKPTTPPQPLQPLRAEPPEQDAATQ